MKNKNKNALSTFKRCVLLFAVLLSFNTSAQDDTTKGGWHSYISPGSTYSNKSIGYGLELGVYNPHLWIALTNETYTLNTKPVVFMTGFRGYYCFYCNASGIWQFYVNAAVKLVDNNSGIFVYEPGMAVVFQPYRHIGLQAGCSLPTTYVTYFSSGLSINFFF